MQRHAPRDGLTQRGLDMIVVEDRPPVLVLLHALGEAREEGHRELLHPLVLLVVVDDDLGGVLAHQVADAAQREIEVSIDEAGAGHALFAPLDLIPEAGEEVDVISHLLIVRVLGGGADDEARPLWPGGIDDVAQPAALLVGADALGDADLRDVRHEHRVATGQRQVARDARALERDRILGDLTQHVLAGLDQLFDLAVRELLARARDPRSGALGRIVAGVIGLAVLEQARRVTTQDVRDVEKGRALHLGPQVDERCLHARQDARDLAAIDVSDHAAVAFAFDKKLGQRALFDDPNTGLGAFGVHHQHVLHLGALQFVAYAPERRDTDVVCRAR